MEWQQFGQKSHDFITQPIELDARINILEGSVRSSKTITLIPKWLIYLMEGPPGLLVITGVSKDTIYDNVLQDLFDTVGSDNYKYNRSSGLLLMGGRTIKVIGAKDEGSEKFLRGKTLAGAYCDELTLMPKRFFLQLLNRMSVKNAKLYATTNPDTPSHYLYTDFITDDEKLASGMVQVIHFELDDNPNLDDEYKDFIKKAYTGVWYQRFILGLWVVAEGAIYDMFGDQHVYDYELKAYILEQGRHYIALDYGTQNATVFLYCVVHNGHVYVVDEWFHSGRTAGQQRTDAQYAQALIEFCKACTGCEKLEDMPIAAVIMDPAAASFRVELRNQGFLCKDADNEVLDGIRLVASMFNLNAISIHKRCVNLKRQLQSYVWDPKPTEKGKEKPLKREDDSVDALRYLAKTIIKNLRYLERG
jgi:PBSX family phage terminase large subunit